MWSERETNIWRREGRRRGAAKGSLSALSLAMGLCPEQAEVSFSAFSAFALFGGLDVNFILVIFRTALTEMNVLLDVLKIAKEKHYMMLDAVSTDAPDSRPGFLAVAKKRVCDDISLPHSTHEYQTTQHLSPWFVCRHWTQLSAFWLMVLSG